jgi:hypothetical protein
VIKSRAHERRRALEPGLDRSRERRRERHG